MPLKILSGAAFASGIFGLVHHYGLTGLWFQWWQLLELRLHHEQLIIGCFAVGVALLCARIKRR